MQLHIVMKNESVKQNVLLVAAIECMSMSEKLNESLHYILSSADFCCSLSAKTLKIMFELP